MTHESDPWLDALRAAWAEESQVPTMPSESLAGTDASTRALVGALKDAWQAEAAMNADAAEGALRNRRRGIRRKRIAAAAWVGLGLAAAAALVLALPSALPGALERRGAAVPADAERELALESAPQPPADLPADLPAESTGTATSTAQVQQITQRPDGVEFRSGGVRVVLVQPMR
ncbi:MAG: hypothetical protein AAGG01_19275 [Planctomycetota bacterium]